MTDVSDVSEGIAAGRLGVAMVAVRYEYLWGKNRDLTRYFRMRNVVGAKTR